MATPHDISIQLRRLHQTGFDEMLARQAQANGFPRSFFYAIASRETNCVNELGDVQSDGAHGVGIVQVDVQYPVALQARNDGSWQTNPARLVAFGAQLLAQNLRQVQQALTSLSSEQQLKVAASGYNCGVTRAIAAVRNGQDSDAHTTGGDYGADVMARKALFEQVMVQTTTAVSAAA
jgi:Transglycosylase SLT domain